MQEQEVWKPVVGYDGLYDVSSFGRIRSHSRDIVCNNRFVVHRKGRIMRPSYNKANGYYSVALSRDGKPKDWYIHRLVATAFLPNPDGLLEVNHKDENKRNNHADNLEWCTRTYNVNYGTGEKRRRESAMRNKRGRCYPKLISQYTLDGIYVASYGSSEEAARSVGASGGGSNIRRCARTVHRNSSSNGYIWIYTDEPSLFL